MLSTQAGHVLGRLRTVCALDVAAGTDSLTGLANRRAWDAALAGLPLGGAVVLFDLDEFKPVNDTHGHAVGDVVLRTFAATLHGCVRDGDLVVRLGGDEFGMLLPSGGESGARLVLDRLAERWGSPHGVAYSTGSAVLRPDETAEQAMLRADAALYGDKRAGHRLG
jgi:diguanylate cyclase (GGDEF)-like protein